MNTKDKQRVEEYFAGRISKDDAEQLSKSLGNNKELRAYFLTYATITEYLDESKPILNPVNFERPSFNFKTKRTQAPYLLIAASIAFAFLFFGFEIYQNQSAPHAGEKETANLQTEEEELVQLIDHFDLSIKGIHSPVENLTWQPGKYHILKGSFHLRFNRSTDFLFQGPGLFEIKDLKNIYVERGNLRTIVLNEKGKGFTVTSPTTSYIDLGTEFDLKIEPDQKDTFNLKQGEVVIVPKTDSISRTTVTRGNQNNQKLPNTQIPEEFTTIFPGLSGKQRSNRIFEQHLKNPDVIGLFNFEIVQSDQITSKYIEKVSGSFPGKIPFINESKIDQIHHHRFFTNHAESSDVTHGVSHKCQRSKGRWPNTYSISFPNEDSKAVLNIAKDYKSLTINFWIQPMYLSNPSNFLIRSYDWNGFGSFGIDIDRMGKTHEHQWGESRLETVRHGEQKLTQNWHLLTYTFGKDGSGFHSKLYIDGKLATHSQPTWTKSIRLGSLLMGGVKRFGFNLNCNIDEMLIIKKTWTEDQIRDYYQNGFPYYQVDADLLTRRHF